jgi:hypothetical protein
MVFAKSPYLLYYIILRLSMSMAAQFITILCCAFCAIYTLRNTPFIYLAEYSCDKQSMNIIFLFVT